MAPSSIPRTTSISPGLEQRETVWCGWQEQSTLDAMWELSMKVISWEARMRKEQWDGRDGVGVGGAVYIAESTRGLRSRSMASSTSRGIFLSQLLYNNTRRLIERQVGIDHQQFLNEKSDSSSISLRQANKQCSGACASENINEINSKPKRRWAGYGNSESEQLH